MGIDPPIYDLYILKVIKLAKFPISFGISSVIRVSSNKKVLSNVNCPNFVVNTPVILLPLIDKNWRLFSLNIASRIPHVSALLFKYIASSDSKINNSSGIAPIFSL